MGSFDLGRAFAMLDDELAARGVSLRLTVVGGAVLQMEGIRATQDVDAFYDSCEAVEEAIRSVGEALGANTAQENWVNGSVANLNPAPPDSVCETVFSGAALVVARAPLDYVAGMKLASAREKDIGDVASIVKALSIADPGDLVGRLEEYGFEAPDESLVLEAFSQAYGMEWLVEYYRANESDGWLSSMHRA